jgi:sterol 14-demethylase
VVQPFRYGSWEIEPGVLVGVSPAISNRMSEHFSEPERFDPGRYREGRDEDKRSFAWLPFGAGRHRCVGAGFAMVQLKTIFAVLLRDYEFELAQPPASYRNDHSKMVVQVAQPCRVAYRRRVPIAVSTATRENRVADTSGPTRLSVDLDLCQGHGACERECPELFAVDRKRLTVELKRDDVPEALRGPAAAAIRACPTGALRAIETPTRGD